MNVYLLNLSRRIFEKLSEYKRITLQDYVRALEACLLSFKAPVIIVGHSLAELVISQVVQHYRERTSRLIYLAAFIPDSGACFFDITK